MKTPYPVWYGLLGLAVAIPLGVRVLTWPAHRQHPLERTMVEAGKVLFTHEWTPHDPLCAGGDGLGPVYNATSCVACHNQGGPGGSGGLEHNVTLFVRQDPTRGEPDRRIEGVVHAHALPGYQETLQSVHVSLPLITRPRLVRKGRVCGKPQVVPQVAEDGSGTVDTLDLPEGVQISQRKTPALFGVKWIDEIPDSAIIAVERSQRLKWSMAPITSDAVPVGRALRLADGRVGRFGWKAQSASLAQFVQAACANELGLGNPGQSQPRPLGHPEVQLVSYDLSAEQCDQITAFIAALPRPQQRIPPGADQEVHTGRELFHKIGCAECHVPEVGSVSGLYSDLLVHRMGTDLEGSGSYNQPPRVASPSPGDGPLPDEWRTPPLWSVADTGPYLHDGRAATLEEAIRLHGGQASRSARQFQDLPHQQQALVVTFLKSLRAP